jgi:predicted peptidase
MPEVDKSRIYVMGASMGGVGTFDIVAHYPELFAAAIPICGAIAPGHLASAKDVSFWIFHGDDDPTVPVRCSRRAYIELKKAGADVSYTEIASGKHGINYHVYNTPGFMKWLFSQKRR